MKKFVTAALMATLAITTTASMAAVDKPSKAVAVKFKAGASGATYNGKIKGYGYDQYSFYAKKGQALKVVTTGNVDSYLFHNRLADSVNLGEYSSDLDSNGDYILPYTGTYQVKVMQTRNDARKGKAPSYTLQLTIR
ncbi:MAG: PPC domain-containing protein [Moraxella sp.]|jgi:hypothetical protein